MKGISLPINIIVILAVAVLVLVVIAVFFTDIIGGSREEIEKDPAYRKACGLWVTSFDCDPNAPSQIRTSYTYPGRTDPASLAELCNEKFTDPAACARDCGCVVP